MKRLTPFHTGFDNTDKLMMGRYQTLVNFSIEKQCSSISHRLNYVCDQIFVCKSEMMKDVTAKVYFVSFLT